MNGYWTLGRTGNIMSGKEKATSKVINRSVALTRDVATLPLALASTGSKSHTHRRDHKRGERGREGK